MVTNVRIPKEVENVLASVATVKFLCMTLSMKLAKSDVFSISFTLSQPNVICTS
jgi:hypothetical protein